MGRWTEPDNLWAKTHETIIFVVRDVMERDLD
jgi:hypothetical protein